MDNETQAGYDLIWDIKNALIMIIKVCTYNVGTYDNDDEHVYIMKEIN